MTSKWLRVIRSVWVGLAVGTVMVLAGRSEAFEGPARPAPEAARWVAADAILYLEMRDASVLIDRLTDERLSGPLAVIPSVKRAIEGDEYRKLVSLAGLVADKLGRTREKVLRDLTGGGGVFAIEAAVGRKPRVVLVVTPLDPATLRNASAALVEGLAGQAAAPNGKSDPWKPVEYRNVRGYAREGGAYVILKDRLVIADGVETARSVIDRALDGPDGSVAENADWKVNRAGLEADALIWGLARMDRLRDLDPKRYGGANETLPKPQLNLLFGGWIGAVRKAPWVAGSVTWTGDRLAVGFTLPVGKGGRGEAFRGFFPPKGSGAPSVLSLPGTVASLSLWRDLSAVWEARADLFRPEDVQNLNKLDTFAGQFFGGRDFGTGVLGALADDWRLVVALQDEKSLNPVPDVKLPAFALVVELKPDDPEFAQRLKVAFQTFIGLANLNTTQSKAPPLELGSETFEGVTISTARFMPAKPARGDEGEAPARKAPVHTRHNFSPSAIQVGDHFVLSSSVGLARDLVKALKSPGAGGDDTLVAEADGGMLARLVDQNRPRLVMQNMLEKGHDKEQAEGEVAFFSSLLRYFGRARLSVRDGVENSRALLEFRLGR